MTEVSVIVPVYNEEKDISACLISLKKQTFKDFEVILIDDGSTDKTIENAKKAAKNLRLKILKQNHQGTGKARNLGAKNANGEILIFVDADMTFDKDYIRNLIKPILNNKNGAVIGTTHDYEIAVNIDKIYSKLWGKIRLEKRELKNASVFRAIRKDKFFEFGGFDQKYGYADDQTFWLKHQIRPLPAENTICYHKNPETLKGTYKQARWIGASWKERFFIFKIPIINYLGILLFFALLPFIVIIKTIKTKILSEDAQYPILKIIKFNASKFYGYAVGISRAVFLGRVWR